MNNAIPFTTSLLLFYLLLLPVSLTATMMSGAEVTGEEAPPTAFFTTSTTSGPAPLAVDFNAFSSSDPDGTVENYAWDFGDGNTASGVFPSNTFQTVGTYQVSLIVTDNDGEVSDPFVVTITVTNTPTPCLPISTLGCDEVAVSVPIALNFSGTEGGLLDGNGIETGFTFVDAPSSNLYPATPTNSDVPGWEAGLVDVSGGLLSLTSTKGTKVGRPTSSGANSNTQVNAIGAGFISPGSVFNLTTELVQPDLTISPALSGQKGGIWYGLDEDNYATLTLRKVSNNSNRIELLVEHIDPNNSGQVVTHRLWTSGFSNTAASVSLRMEVDPVYNVVRGYYRINGGSEILITENEESTLPLPQLFVDGKDHDQNATTANLSFGGLFATHRNAPEGEPIVLSFADFGVDAPPVTPTLIFEPGELDISLVQGTTPQDYVVELLSNNSTTPTITLSDDPHAGAWLDIPASPAVGELVFRPKTGLAAGTYSTTILGVANGYVNAELDVTLIVTDPNNVPQILGTIPTDGATDVSLNAAISANNLFMPNDLNGVFGVDNSTITNQTVKLFKVSSQTEIPATVNGTGGGDAINLTPSIPLEINTTYRFEVDGVKDLTGVAFATFTSTFVTAADNNGSGNALDAVSFEKVGAVATDGMYTSLVIGPDDKLYGLNISGDVDRWTIEADGTLSGKQTITTITSIYGNRSAVGFAFSPNSTSGSLVAFVSHAEGVLNGGQPWDGKISRLSGPNLETEDLIVTNLPRSRRDHLTNSITFRPGEPNALYFNQGSNTAGGAPDNSWGNRKERLLTAATLRLDLDKLPPSAWPLNAKTTMNQTAINSVDVNSPTLGSGTGTYDESGSTFPDDGTYNPFYLNAPLTIYATGIRNAYDLLWHSNGQLYVPNNGTAGGSNSPASVDGTRRIDGVIYDHSIPTYPPVPATSGNNTQRDFLFRIDPNTTTGYYGHPNPLRGEYILNRGPVDVNNYPNSVGTDPNFRGIAFDFEFNKSPNGVIEYRSNAEGGNLQGAILVCRYSGGSDIIALVPNGPNGDILTSKTGIPGFSGFTDPLDIVEEVNSGNLYVSDLAQQTIVLLRPSNQASPEPQITLNPESVLLDQEVGNGASPAITVFITNSGNATLENPSVSLLGPDASEFVVDASSLPASLAPNSSTSVLLSFDPASEGPKQATLEVTGTNANTTPLAIRGLGEEGAGGNQEPSLQYIFDAHQLGIDVGDLDAGTNQIDLPNGLTYNDLIGDEVPAQYFERATPNPVSLEVLSVYGPEAANPISGFGWYAVGQAEVTGEVFTVGNTISGNGQTINPVIAGSTEFDPGTAVFGLYSRWPFFNNRHVYSEDDRNAFSNAIPRHVRVYEVPGEDNAYVIAFEEHTSGFDYQDLVVVIRNVTVSDAVLAPAIAADPFESLFETSVRPDAPHQDTSIITITNPGSSVLAISSVTLTGDFVSDYSFTGPQTLLLEPAATQEYEVIFAPTLNGDDRGYKEGALVFTTNTEEGVFEYGLHGLKKNGLGGTHEPSLQAVVNTLGIPVDVGWTTLQSDTDPIMKGEEVDFSLFEAAGTGPVTIVPVARYSPQELLPYGWYTNRSGVVTTHEVAELAAGNLNGQTLYPPIDNGGTEFDPQGAAFGFFVESNAFNRTNYTEDQLNTGGVAHRTRIYPTRERSGALVPNSYLVCFEDAANGDYNDYVFVISNVQPFMPPDPSLEFTVEHLDLTAVQGELSDNKTSAITTDFAVENSDLELTALDPWIILPTIIRVNTPMFFGANSAGLAYGLHYGQVVVSAPGFISDTLDITLAVRHSETNAVFVNFQDSTFRAPSGFLPDEGAAFGERWAGFSYGWVDPATGAPADNTAGARGAAYGVTNASSETDKLLSSLNHLDLNGGAAARDWEVALPNGLYRIKVAAGDPVNPDGQHVVRAEEEVLVDNFMPSPTSSFRIRIDTVRVNGGRLTIDDEGAPASGNSRIIYFEATPVDSSGFLPEIFTELTGNQNAAGEYYGSADLTMSASDRSGSGGIASLRYRINGGTSVDYTGAVELTATSNPVNYSVEVEAIDNFGNVRVETVNLIVIPASGALVRLENMTKVPFTQRGFPADDFYAFNTILNPINTRGDTIRTQLTNVMRLHNDGTGPLIISELTTTNTDNFIVKSPAIPNNGLVVSAGDFLDVTLELVVDDGDRRLVTEQLVITSNADNALEFDVTMRGGIAVGAEGNNELTNQQMFELFGFGTEMGKDNNGNYIVRPSSDIPPAEDINAGTEGDMILSGYFRQADPSEPIIIFKLAAMHGPGGARTQLTNSLDQRPGNVRYVHAPLDYQRILSKDENTDTRIAGDFGNLNQEFRVTVAGYRTSGGNARGNLENQILGARVYKVRDRNGNVVPNEYIIIQDYIGNGCGAGSGNCDWNDNIEYIINARPAVLPTASGIPDRTIDILTPETYELAGFFDRGYPGNHFTFQASLTDGANLPSWLVLDTQTGVLSYEAPFTASGQDFAINVIATDNNGIVVNSSFLLSVEESSVNCSVDANFDDTPKVLDCNNPTVTLSGLTSTGNYQWSGPGGFSSNQQNPVVAIPGVYTLATSGDCPLTDEVTVTAGSSDIVLTISAPDLTLTCSVNELQLSAVVQNPPVTFTWFDPADQELSNAATITVSEPGIYRVVAVNATGCTEQSSITITEDLTPQDAGMDGNLSVCTSDPVVDLFAQLSAFGGDPSPGGHWTLDGNSVSNSLDPASATSGVYVYTVGGVSGCPIDQAELTLTIITATTYYSDIDFDGLGDPAESVLACEAPTGYVANNLDNCPDVNSSDLTDTDSDGEGDVCDPDDDNDGVFDVDDCAPLDAGIGAPPVYYADYDADGFGDPAESQTSCNGAPENFVANNLDNCPDNFNPDQRDLDGDGIGDACDGSVLGRSSFWLEAECGEVGANWQQQFGTNASGDEYVVALQTSTATAPADLPENRLRYVIDNVQAGNYHIFARIWADNSGEDSFWVRINNGDWIRWWQGIIIDNDFAWNELVDSPYPLVDGTNTIDIAFREVNAKLDKIHLDQDDAFPTGYGQDASNCDNSVNLSPTAVASVNPTNVEIGETITLDGSGSSDSDGFVIEYKWSWGADSTAGEFAQISLPAGRYDITLTVMDDQGATDQDFITVDFLDPQADTDGDGILDVNDNCPLVHNPNQELFHFYPDVDGDGFGDPSFFVQECEAPAGYVSNDLDNCPDVASQDLTDTDLDGEGDICDPDDDGDGVPDVEDCQPLDPLVLGPVTYYSDNDADGFGDPNDAQESCSPIPGYVTNNTDNCPDTYNPDQLDGDNDGIGNVCDASVVGVSEFWLEAECATVGSGWTFGNFSGASNGQAVYWDSGNTYNSPPADIPANRVRFTLESVQAGSFHLFARVYANGDSNNSFWVRVNDGAWIRWWQGINSNAVFAWNEVLNSPFQLVDGLNTIDFAYREDDTILDKIHVHTDGTFPSGDGEVAANCTQVPNDPPVALANATPLSGVEPLDIALDGSGSTDADGVIVSYDWNWNGGSATGLNPTITLPAGLYSVTLTVADEDGASATDVVNIEVFQDPTDTDGDGVRDAADNCPTVPNPGQNLFTFYADTDNDGFGDPAQTIEACTAPAGYVANADDNCPGVGSTDLTDTDSDGEGDLCDPDDDGDGVADTEDCFPLDPTRSAGQLYYADFDGDGFGDPNATLIACTLPPGYVTNNTDNCPDEANPDQEDIDNDGIGDVCDDFLSGVNEFWLEAECAEVGSRWSVRTDPVASNGSYVVFLDGRSTGTPPPDVPENYVRFTLPATTQAGTYNLFARLRVANNGTDSFWGRINGGPWTLWGNNFILGDDFFWNEVTAGPLTVTDGINTIDFAYREDNAQLDKLYLSLAPDLPTGFGEPDTECTDNDRPIAVAASDINSGFSPLTVQLDASASSDVDGTITDYAWSWSNGTETGNASGVSPSVVLTDLGNYVVTLVVTDNDGAIATDQITVLVSEAPNQPPMAVAMATPSSGITPLSVELDASGSVDGDGSIVSYTWDWNGGSATGAVVTEIFTTGVYQLTLTVTDNEGASDTDELIVEVFDDETDTDGDGIFDADDNCPTVPNPDQSLTTFYADIDGDGFGDPANPLQACEAPAGYVTNADDNCPDVNSTDLTDTDNDGSGDICDNDDDDDGVPDVDDCDPLDDQIGAALTYYADFDGDGFGDPANPLAACSQPVDYVLDNTDNCPNDANPDQADDDNDGIGNVCDPLNGGESIFWLEAECAIIGSAWETRSDADAANSKYVVRLGDNANGAPPADVSENHVSFVIPDVIAGDYQVFARVRAASTGDDSFWVRVNGGEWFRWWQGIVANGQFGWNQIVGTSFNLTNGTNVIDFAYRENGAELDKLHLNLTGDTPVGVGSTASNCGVVANQPPVANAQADVSEGIVPLTVELDGSASTDADGNIVSYAWSWNDGGSATGSNPQVVLSTADVYDITLTVTDDQGASAMDVITVTASEPPNEEPVANASATPSNGIAPLAVELDGSASMDADGNIVSYSWTWDGGGAASGAIVQEIFSVGNYTITLTVTDDEGATNTTTLTVDAFMDQTDTDGDGVLDVDDNCPTVHNPNQELFTFYADTDGDGFGDPASSIQACTAPAGYVVNDTDNCPEENSADLSDNDGDGIGDICDDDDDNDGVIDSEDCAPLDDQIGAATTYYADFDGDGFGDPANSLTDCTQPVDYVVDNSDNCPDVANVDQADDDNDGIGNACDPVVGPNTSFWLEAECASLGAWEVRTNSIASANNYVIFGGEHDFAEPTIDDPAKMVTATVEISQAGDYYFFLRLNAPDGGRNSLWVRVDDGNWIKMWKEIGGQQLGTSGFEWKEVNDDGTALVFNLATGTHTLTVHNREPGTELDKFYLSTDATLPTGFGDGASNCVESLATKTAERGMTSGVNTKQAPTADGTTVLVGSSPLPPVTTGETVGTTLSVFPNPTSDNLNFRLSSDHRGVTEATILDLSGRVVATQRYDKGTDRLQDRLELNDLPAGTYLLRVTEGDRHLNRKFVKMP